MSAAVPPRAEWPEAEPSTLAGAVLTDLILATFRLNARLLEAAQALAAEGAMTAAWWQVIGGVLDEPRTVAGVARRMGMARQSVQRIADLLVERGLAEFRDNPAHQRAKLLAPTEAGFYAVRQISVAQHPWAAAIGEQVGERALRDGLRASERLLAALDAAATSPPAR